ncbi:MAG: Transglutaminase-like superfamily protein [Syntrophorhabdaceae bacterium PtaU1.Bin034]|nr:MAG: Transglutaminase-like superfamily protein [Syntrophorhabdaceae bacterium PtaU1.Bin034]
MKNVSLILVFLAFLSILGCSGSHNSSPDGQTLYDQAVASDQAGAYITALQQYRQAWPLLLKEGNIELVKQCRLAVKRLDSITDGYTATEQMVRSTLTDLFPSISESTINYLLSRIDSLVIEGATYYYQGFINTAVHLDLSLMRQLQEAMDANRSAYQALKPYVTTPGPLSGTPFRNPITYLGTASYNIPRNLLPQGGVLQLWQPVPIQSDCQSNVSVVSVQPQSYFKNQTDINGDIGDIYLEVPLGGLSSDLSIEVQFRFTHYEQRFTMIDPANVGTYDKNSNLYLLYTASRENTFISPEIAAKAREITAGEQNPYYAARKIYDYIVDELTYSHMPHAALGALEIPESVFVHNHRYGDCGGQSIYFSALCRSLGIPARATGGYQLFPGMEDGHFWAEFYLPNYGWVPVDTSIAQINRYLPELTVAEQEAFKDYFFGGMDPLRWVIQRDVDLPFVPTPSEPTLLPITLQFPGGLCDSMAEIPEKVIWANYRISFSREP